MRVAPRNTSAVFNFLMSVVCTFSFAAVSRGGAKRKNGAFVHTFRAVVLPRTCTCYQEASVIPLSYPRQVRKSCQDAGVCNGFLFATHAHKS